MKKEVFIIVATSQDGFISPKNMQGQSSTKWTSPEDTKFFAQKTKTAGVVIYGSKTYLTIPDSFRPLKDRLNVVYTHNPDSIPSKSNILTTQLPPQKLIPLLQSKGYSQIAICGGHSIYELFIQSGVVDRVYQTIEPVTFNNGVPFLSASSQSLLTQIDTIPLSESTKIKVWQVEKIQPNS